MSSLILGVKTQHHIACLPRIRKPPGFGWGRKKITLLNRLLISVRLLNYIFNHFVSYFFCSSLPSLPLMWELHLQTIVKHTTKQTNPQLRHQLHFYELGGREHTSKDWNQPFGKATPINSEWQRIGLNLAPISFPVNEKRDVCSHQTFDIFSPHFFSFPCPFLHSVA